MTAMAKTYRIPVCWKMYGYVSVTADSLQEAIDYAIARKTNAGLKNPLRYAGAIQYTLEEAMNSGHLFLPESELMEKSHQLLNSGFEVEIIHLHPRRIG